MATAIGRPRVILLLMMPLTIPVLFGTLRVPLGLLGLAIAGVVSPELFHAATVIIALLCTLAIHVKMWRALKPSEPNGQGSA